MGARQSRSFADEVPCEIRPLTMIISNVMKMGPFISSKGNLFRSYYRSYASIRKELFHSKVRLNLHHTWNLHNLTNVHVFPHCLSSNTFLLLRSAKRNITIFVLIQDPGFCELAGAQKH